jgi:hypothetical protein
MNAALTVSEAVPVPVPVVVPPVPVSVPSGLSVDDPSPEQPASPRIPTVPAAFSAERRVIGFLLIVIAYVFFDRKRS